MSRTLPTFLFPRKSKFVSRRTSILLPIELSGKFDHLVPFCNHAYFIRLDSELFHMGHRLSCKFFPHDSSDADTHVECTEHVRVIKVAEFFQHCKYRKDAYLREVDARGKTIGQYAVQILLDAAAGDVCQSHQPLITE